MMRSRVSIVLLTLLISLVFLSAATPDSLAQDVATEESALHVESVKDSDVEGTNVLNYAVDEDGVPDPGAITREITIEGTGFLEGARVEFRRVFPNGTTYTITPSSEKIHFESSTTIEVEVPASVWVDDDGNLLPGLWDVWVINPDGHSASPDEQLSVETFYRDPDFIPIPPSDDEDEDPLENLPRSLCIIATAAYGSEMAPEVQFLRGFRDHTVRSTFAGSSFMDAFNSFYYSWSPGVADSIRDVEEAKAFTRGMIVPLLGVLAVSLYAYNLLSFAPELGVMLTGFLASSMLGAIYLTLPMIALLRLGSQSRRSVIIRKGIIVLLGLSATGFAITFMGVYTLASSSAMIGSAIMVLSSMFGASLVVSSLVLAHARPTYLRINSMWNIITGPMRARRE